MKKIIIRTQSLFTNLIIAKTIPMCQLFTKRQDLSNIKGDEKEKIPESRSVFKE